MADTNTMNAADTAAVTAAANDLVSAATLGKQVVDAYKSGGMKSVSSLLGQVIVEAEKDFSDIKTAIPAIKAGIKTTEFWLVVSLPVVNGVYAAFAHKALPFDVNAVAAALIMVYTAARALTKSTAAKTA